MRVTHDPNHPGHISNPCRWVYASGQECGLSADGHRANSRLEHQWSATTASKACRLHPDGCFNPLPIPSPEEIEAEGKKPLDADDLEIIEQVLVSAGVLGTTLTKVVRMYREALLRR